MREASDGGAPSFVFALPASAEWAGRRARITLSGRAGAASLAGDGPGLDPRGAGSRTRDAPQRGSAGGEGVDAVTGPPANVAGAAGRRAAPKTTSRPSVAPDVRTVFRASSGGRPGVAGQAGRWPGRRDSSRDLLAWELLWPKCNHRIEVCRPPGRDQTGHETQDCEERDDAGERRRIRRADHEDGL